MRLRNKKTKVIGSLISCINMDNYKIASDDYRLLAKYDSLEKVSAEWEDYKPTEPLIKDEKVRKAVRTWAETNQSKFIRRNGNYTASDNRGLMIEFNKSWTTYMENGKQYTITELCGEEEE